MLRLTDHLRNRSDGMCPVWTALSRRKEGLAHGSVSLVPPSALGRDEGGGKTSSSSDKNHERVDETRCDADN